MIVISDEGFCQSTVTYYINGIMSYVCIAENSNLESYKIW